MNPQIPGIVRTLLEHETPPCISLYMPTARAKPPAIENAHRLKSLIDEAQSELRRNFPHRQTDPLIEQLRRLMDDADFWAHPADSLAAFASPATFQAIKLQQPVRDMVHVGDTFHLKPLIRSLQFTGRFQVLGLSQHHVRLFEGNRDALAEVPLRNVPANIIDALGLLAPGEPAGPVVHAPPGAASEPRTQSISGGMDLERFFRVIDAAILDHYSRPSGLPLVLCAVEEHHSLFHHISRNPNLLEEGVRLHPDSIDMHRLREEAWKIIEPRYQRELDRVLDQFRQARAHERGSEDLAQVAEAACQARVGTLLVDADKQVGGRIDLASGKVEFADLSRPGADDLLDEIAEQVLKTGGKVLVMPHAQMPTDTGVAAIYRF